MKSSTRQRKIKGGILEARRRGRPPLDPRQRKTFQRIAVRKRTYLIMKAEAASRDLRMIDYLEDHMEEVASKETREFVDSIKKDQLEEYV